MRAAHLLASDPDAEAEQHRLHVLRALDLLDTPAEAEFDALVQIARHIADCPMALISLLDERRQWFKARCGLAASETPRDIAFCSHALHLDDIMIVPDASLDARFADNPMVTGPAHIRFYAGVPIRVSLEEGGVPATLGTICVVDTRPRTLEPGQAAMLKQLALLAEKLIRQRKIVGDAVRYGEERRAAAARIERQHRQLVQAERIAQIGSWRLALEDQRIEWSDQVFEIHDLPSGPLPALHDALDFYRPQSRAVISDAITAAVQTGAPFDVEADLVSATGREKRIRSMGELEVVDGRPIAVVGVVQDITVRFQLEQALRRSARQDPLTGIANRAGFTTALDAAIDGARAARRPLALLLIDLDGFKTVNDTHGHLAGDMILQEVAQRLQAPYLAGCVPARLGGDEFVMIVNRPADCTAIAEITHTLLDALKKPIAITRGQAAISGTIGIGWLDDDISRGELLHRADLALYDAKRAGKGVARTWSPATPDVASTLRRHRARPAG